MNDQSVRVRAAGKVNICLHVGPVNTDGYHELATVFQSVSVYDHLTFQTAPVGEYQVFVVGDQADSVPVDGRNLARNAVEYLVRSQNRRLGVSIEIEKGIPVAGGMAGGSANAAAALFGVSHLWGFPYSQEDLIEMAAKFGADVPFCVLGGTALGVGRGDIVTSLIVRGDYHWVFAFAFESLSTPTVFREYDRLFPNPSKPKVSESLITALAGGDVAKVGQMMSNDLQPAALALLPKLAEVLRVGTEAGALGGLVSGSGPTCAFLAETSAEAKFIESELLASRLCRAVRRASGPVRGVTLIE